MQITASILIKTLMIWKGENMSNVQRLDKILSNMGYGSRKQVKKHIKDGLIKINGKIVLDNKIKLDPNKEEIYIGNERLNYREYIYIMLNKPKGYVSSTDDPRSDTVIDLLDTEYLIFNPFPIGRLDKDTEGLLLLSNDGELAHNLLSPKKGVEKTYYAEVDGYVKEEHISIFKEGIIINDEYKTLPANLEIESSDIISKVYLTIKEGKYHQVKRMFKSLNMEVLYLKRISMGNLHLDNNLKLGEYRELSEDEINLLKKL